MFICWEMYFRLAMFLSQLCSCFIIYNNGFCPFHINIYISEITWIRIKIFGVAVFVDLKVLSSVKILTSEKN